MGLFGASLRLTPSGLTRKFAPGEFLGVDSFDKRTCHTMAAYWRL
jgi:hypothetical protein